ncbi:metallophosphoesterase [Enterococcus sp. JM9B]|uniref:metallophosphoesterase n=1 Tax=Enterococcus sp. JM9B TaxID=1857216 RepID=UPI001374C264|nr:metallophosphoesterase [Enterococcus sp. JM9B]KAF1300584.1 metallophosphatase [Enterococcus sp. JM9B]
MKFFTGDTHYFHDSLLGKNDFAPRLFKTTEKMHETMIHNWNLVVEDKDTVYHLGDVAMHPNYEAGFPEILSILSQLRGKIVFIKGNHDTRDFFKYLAENDPKTSTGENKFAFEDVGVLLKFNHHQYYLTHYPMLLGTTKNIRNLHGHIHHYSVPIPENINVGVDAPELDFLPEKMPFGTPISENQIDQIAAEKAAELAKLR